MDDDDNKAVIFVFYAMEKSSSWNYRLSKGWWWVGSGTSQPVGHQPTKYPREEQFDGPMASRRATRDYLQAKFEKLKSKGIIQRFKIRYSFKP